MSSQRKKNDPSKKEDSDMAHTPKSRQKRGSTSHTPIFSLVDTYDDVQCNSLPTSCNKISKSRSVSALSSTDIGCQRRSARLSQVESQLVLQTPEKKKKKNDDSKNTKDKRKSFSNISSEKNSEKSVSKRTSLKTKNLGETPVYDHLRDSEEGDEPMEKRPKRNSRRSVKKDMNLEDNSREEKDNGSGTERSNTDVTPKLGKKKTSKRSTSSEQLIFSEHCVEDSTFSIPENENQDRAFNVSKRKVSCCMSSNMESTLEEEQQTKSEIDCKQLLSVEDGKNYSNSDAVTKDYEEAAKPSKSKQKNKSIDLKFDQGNERGRSIEYNRSSSNVKSSKLTQDHASKALKSDIVAKECPIVKSITPANKEDIVQEYNRSISEKISLLKPKAFIGRSSATFRKTVDDQGEGSGQEIDSDAESRRAIRESAQRRIEQNLSTSESDSRYFRGLHTPIAHSSKNDSSESDSAPEAVSFAAARHEAIETIKSAAEHVKREKQRLKERRKARLEMLKQQKEEKLIRLKEKMASQEDASCSSSEESGYEEEIRNARLKLKKKKAKSKSQRTEKENLDDATGQVSMKTHSGAASDDSSDEDFNPPPEATSLSSLKRVQTEMFQSATEAAQNTKMQKVGSSSNKSSYEDNLKKKKSKSGKLDDCDRKDRGFKSLTSLDYIPLSTEGATKFMVVPLDKAMRAPKSLAEEAANFRQNMLYGSRIKREPAKVISAYQQKLIASGKNFHVR